MSEEVKVVSNSDEELISSRTDERNGMEDDDDDDEDALPSSSQSAPVGISHAKNSNRSALQADHSYKGKALQAAVKIILEGGMSHSAARGKYRLTCKKLDAALIKTGSQGRKIVERSRRYRPSRRSTEDRPNLQKAVKDVMVHGKIIGSVCKLRRTSHATLRRHLVKAGFKLTPQVSRASDDQVQAAVKDMLQRNRSLSAAAKLHHVGKERLRKIVEAQKQNTQEDEEEDEEHGEIELDDDAELRQQDSQETVRLNCSNKDDPPSDDRKTRIDAAVNAIISGERCIWESVKKFKVGDEEVDRALMERGEIQLVNKARMRRSRNSHNRKIPKSLQLAMDAVMLKNETLTVAAKRYGIKTAMLRRRLSKKGVQLPPSQRDKLDPVKLHKACRAVVQQGLSTRVSGKQHGINRDRIRAELMSQGYVYQNSKVAWIKQSSKEDAQPDKQECQTDSEDETNSDEVTESATEDEGVCAKAVVDENVSSPRKEGKSMERIVDLRVKRQYLIKWQGEEEPTWVDEDIFVGLACQTMC